MSIKEVNQTEVYTTITKCIEPHKGQTVQRMYLKNNSTTTDEAGSVLV